MDRITRVRIRNARAIKAVDLEISRPVTVLIGPNGSGKSTILECLEVLKKAGDAEFMRLLYAQHRGLHGLLRRGAGSLELGVVVEDDAGLHPRIDYRFRLTSRGAGAVVEEEHLLVGPVGQAAEPLVAIRRHPDRGQMFDQHEGKLVPVPPQAMKPDRLVIASFGQLPPQKAIERVLDALRGIEVQLPFDTVASWAARAYQLTHSTRSSTTFLPAERVDLLGFNLANAWSELKNRTTSEWDALTGLVRLGLGEHIDAVRVRADPGGGHVALFLGIDGLAEPVSAADLSDGQLAWLAFVAMAHLNPGRSLLAVDEPELHLHPALLGRVFSLLSSLSGDPTVVISTHSDRILELLDDADAVRVCTLDGGLASVHKLDGGELPGWLERFGDLGQLRASGYLPRLLAPASSPEVEE